MPEIPRLSPTIAHKLLTESPLAAWAAHRLLGNIKKSPSKTQIEGRMWHAAILGDAHDIVVVDYDDFRSNAAKELYAAALAKDKIPVARPIFDALEPAAMRIRENIRALDIMLDGSVEERVEWSETVNGIEVLCSGYVDHHLDDEIHEVKTGKTATSEREAANLICRNHALMQGVAYPEALKISEHDFIYVFVQTQEPYSVTPVKLDPAFREMANMRWQRALSIWSKCLEKGTEREHWPDVTRSNIATIAAPSWMLSREIDEEIMADEY